MTSVEPSPLPTRPPVNKNQALFLANRLFGLDVADASTTEEFNSYEDRNFYMRGTLRDTKGEVKETGSSTDEFILKIVNHTYSVVDGLIEAQSSSMLYLIERGFHCQEPISSRFGGTEVMCKVPQEGPTSSQDDVTEVTKDHGLGAVENGESTHLIGGIGLFNGEEYDSDKFFICAVRLLTFIPGQVLCDVPWTEDLLYHLGRHLGEVDLALQKFDHPSLNNRKLLWDMKYIPALESYTHAVSDSSHKELVLQVCRRFKEEVLPKLPCLNKQVIHADLSDQNIILTNSKSDDDCRYDFCIIDFAHLNKSYRVFEVAVSLMYHMNTDMAITVGRLQTAGNILAGYQSTFPLSELELDLLYVSVAARFCQSLVIGAYTYKHIDPGNAYLLVTAKKGWEVFQEYLNTSKEEVLGIWRSISISRSTK